MITVSFGTEASENAYKNFAPCLIIPPHSWAVPGKNPGTSTKEIRGMLKQSQNLINLVALSQELISRTPAKTSGLFAIIPTELPSNLAKPIMMF